MIWVSRARVIPKSTAPWLSEYLLRCCTTCQTATRGLVRPLPMTCCSFCVLRLEIRFLLLLRRLAGGSMGEGCRLLQPISGRLSRGQWSSGSSADRAHGGTWEIFLSSSFARSLNADAPWLLPLPLLQQTHGLESWMWLQRFRPCADRRLAHVPVGEVVSSLSFPCLHYSHIGNPQTAYVVVLESVHTRDCDYIFSSMHTIASFLAKDVLGHMFPAMRKKQTQMVYSESHIHLQST